MTFRSSDPGTVFPIINVAFNGVAFLANTAGHFVIDGFQIQRNTGSSSSSGGFNITSGSQRVEVRRCIIDGSSFGFGIAAGTASNPIIEDCEVFGVALGGNPFGMSLGGGRPNAVIRRCSFHDNVGPGISLGGFQSYASIVIDGCLSYDNGGDGIVVTTLSVLAIQMVIMDTICDRNDGDGISLDEASPDVQATAYLEGNVLSNNGGFGVNTTPATAFHVVLNRNNHYFNNTSGARNNLAVGENDTSGDPLYTITTDGFENYTPLPGSPLVNAGAIMPTS